MLKRGAGLARACPPKNGPWAPGHSPDSAEGYRGSRGAAPLSSAHAASTGHGVRGRPKTLFHTETFWAPNCWVAEGASWARWQCRLEPGLLGHPVLSLRAQGRSVGRSCLFVGLCCPGGIQIA